MDPATIKDPKLRKRIADADAAQNGAGKNGSLPFHSVRSAPAPLKKRLRQSTQPLMNKLEAEFYETIRAAFPNYPPVRCQAKRYRLGNGIWYKPDFTVSSWPCEFSEASETAWEVKGPKAFRGGFENLKVAASQYPEVRWVLVWKDKATGEWREQHVIP